jgi:hypothetical protein
MEPDEIVNQPPQGFTEPIEQAPQTDEQAGIMKLNVEFEIKTGKVKIGGHIDNTDICIKVLVEAAHLIMVRNSEADRARMKNTSRAIEIAMRNAKQNGNHENAPAPAAN